MMKGHSMQTAFHHSRSAVAAVAMLAAVSLNAPSALAVGTGMSAHAVASPAGVQTARWGGHGRYGGWRHHGYGWGGAAVGAGILGLIIGGSIAASRETYRSRWDDCAATYRSFRWSDGTFQPYGGGPREVCPYLRG